jgi:mannose-6-phosphate isomerase-like protein (cupin superfamily)
MTPSTITPTTPALRRGDARWFFGQLAVVRATGEDTGGAYTLLEVTAPPGLEAPLHVHHVEDEGFLVLDGTVSITIGDEPVEAGPGDFVNGPRSVPHSFRVGPEGARMIWVLTPSGFENLVAAASVPATEPVVPPSDVLPPADAAEIVRRFGNELLQ